MANEQPTPEQVEMVKAWEREEEKRKKREKNRRANLPRDLDEKYWGID